MSRRPLSTKAGAPVRESRMRCAGGAEQVLQVRSLRLVELQGVGKAVDDAVGDAGGVATLELRHVLRRDPGQAGDLGAAQPRHPTAVPAVHGKPGLLGTDPGAAGGEELTDLGANVAADVAVVVPLCHALDCTGGWELAGVPVSTLSRGLPPS